MIHPIISKRNRFIVYWLIWLIIGLGQSLLVYFSSGTGTTASFADGFFSAVIFALLSMALWFPVNYFNAGDSSLRMSFFNHLGIALIVLALWIFITKYLVISVLRDETEYLVFWKNSIYYRIGAGAFMYAVIILTYYLMISMDNIAKKNIREAKLENTLKETELMMLRSQINPHFLFNSLNSISSLTVSDAGRAREMVIKLSEFMRYALSQKEDRTVSLETELGHLRLYLDIEKVRFGERLIIEENVSPGCLKFPIPNMILQPLYENAIKHGVYESTDTVRIKLSTEALSSGILIRISNDYDPASIPAGGTGTGLKNIRRRLELYYGKRSWLLTEKDNSIFTAELFIPGKTDTRT
ncbi:MAG: histidine kinase [Bacteroidales bacterium]|nr:histidine kinase [Bacteroidales bacterium]